MDDCEWCKDEICVNADCPMCCDYCPVPDVQGVCRFEDREGKEIESEPEIDAVPVVRCMECAIPHNKYTGCPKLNGLVTPPDFYCLYGERRENAVD